MAGTSTDWGAIINNNVLSLAFVMMVLTFSSFALSYSAHRMEHVSIHFTIRSKRSFSFRQKI